MADANWVRFARRAGIDLRSLPYSFLVLDHARGASAPARSRTISVEGASRIIGAPRVSKPSARILSCQQDGARDLILERRDAPDLFRTIKRGEQNPVYRWRLEGDRIKSGEPVHEGA